MGFFDLRSTIFGCLVCVCRDPGFHMSKHDPKLLQELEQERAELKRELGNRGDSGRA